MTQGRFDLTSRQADVMKHGVVKRAEPLEVAPDAPLANEFAHHPGHPSGKALQE